MSTTAARTLRLLAIAALVAFLGGHRAGAAPREQRGGSEGKGTAKADELVGEALAREAYGLAGERDRLLRQALALNPDYAPARWHTGHVKLGKDWVTLEDRTRTAAALPEGWEAYLQQRERTAGDFAGQLALANWCRAVNLDRQEQAHLYQAMRFDPGNLEVRQRLGFRRVNGKWVVAEDLWNGLRDRESALQTINKRASDVEKIVRGLEARSLRRRDAAKQQLQQLAASVQNLPAIEVLLCGRGGSLGLEGLNALATNSSFQASHSLARQAVTSLDPVLAQTAAELLRARPRDGYVPALLHELNAPLESRIETAVVNGRMVYRHLVAQEGREENEVTVWDTVVRRRGGRDFFDLSSPSDRAAVRVGDLAAQRDATRNLAARAARREREILRRNMRLEAVNERIFQTLRVATDNPWPRSVQEWWRWWDEQNGVVSIGEKYNQVSYYGERLTYSPPPPQTPRTRGECFVAGTPVWVPSGTAAIETIRPGDLVLSQSPVTGELRYQTVLDTSIRPAEPLLELVTGEDSLVASGGHPFWIPGRGWTLLRKLQSGDLLHSLAGPVHVSDVRPAQQQRTYNLVVADFHSYVVGAKRLLCHDNSERKPTNALVPGVNADGVVASRP